MADETPHTNLAKLDTLIAKFITDLSSGNPVVMSTIHNKIHRGQVYVFGHYDSAVSNNASLEILFKAGAEKRADIIYNISSSGDTVISLFETPTITVDGTPLVPRNKSRYFDETETFDVFHTPTTSVDGTELLTQFLAGGSGGLKIGASTDERDEWNFKHGMNYLLRVQNVSGQASKVNIVASVYELTPPSL